MCVYLVRVAKFGGEGLTGEASVREEVLQSTDSPAASLFLIILP